MYRFLSIKEYRYLDLETGDELSNTMFEEFKYGKTIPWDDYVGKWPEEKVHELPYYHPYWRHQVELGQNHRMELLKRKIKELEGNPKHARELENFKEELKNFEKR